MGSIISAFTVVHFPPEQKGSNLVFQVVTFLQREVSSLFQGVAGNDDVAQRVPQRLTTVRLAVQALIEMCAANSANQNLVVKAQVIDAVNVILKTTQAPNSRDDVSQQKLPKSDA